ncbi:MAG: DUF190 domain-containing protein [Okeania sp. SIO3B3]|nr:DUF190 domain-containing protein [Okeania sp. SIO3B3]
MSEKAKRLRVYLSERDHAEGRPLWQTILERAHQDGLTGAVVFKGLAGYGAHHRIKATNVLALSEDLPLVMEIVDAESRLQPFMTWLDSTLQEGLATLEDVEARLFRNGKRAGI